MNEPVLDAMPAELRRQAEALAGETALPEAGDLCAADAARLAHELHVSRIALGLQTEALRQSQAALAEARQRCDTLYDRAPAAACTLDATGLVLNANRLAASLLGLSEDELAGQSFGARLAGPDANAFGDCLARVQDSGLAQHLHMRLTRGDGSLFEAQLTLEPSPDQEPSPSGRTLRLVIADVTESSLARRDLETVLDSAPIPIVKVRLTDTGERVLEYQNPAAERVFGPQALGKSCKSYLCNKDTCPVLTDASGLVRDRECSIKTLAGDRIMYKTARKMPGSSYIIEAMVDVTELMRTRERLTRAMEASEAANRAKSQFLATMSHEIRTPMNGILGMLELALTSDLPPEQHDCLSLARQSSQQLLEIVNDILDFSRIEAGRLELVKRPFAVRETLQACLRLFDGLAARNADTLLLSVHPDVPETLVGDPGRLAQVVGNLASNGLKFTHNGEVRVSVAPVMPLPGEGSAAPSPGINLLFSVSDDGIGIPTDKQEAIFDYFTQLDPSLNRGAGGTGLGLSISKSLVELMGGRIWVQSTPEKGSAFFFTAAFEPLQANAQAAAPSKAAPSAEPQASPMRILLVEDNLINQLVAKRLLERRGHMVTAVDSGAAALELLADTPFHCVLMDVEMPEMSGPQTLALLRDSARFGEAAATPVVALTAHAVKGYRERMIEAGFDDYVAKPIDIHELDAALKRIANEANGSAR